MGAWYGVLLLTSGSTPLISAANASTSSDGLTVARSIPVKRWRAAGRSEGAPPPWSTTAVLYLPSISSCRWAAPCHQTRLPASMRSWGVIGHHAKRVMTRGRFGRGARRYTSVHVKPHRANRGLAAGRRVHGVRRTEHLRPRTPGRGRRAVAPLPTRVSVELV